MRPVIIVFAKAPVPGRVKTRLVPPLTHDDAARLHTAFVLDTLEWLEPFTAIADLELHTDLATPAWPALALPRRLQHEGDLGLKMLKALDTALAAGHPRAFILGSDSPTLPPAHLRALLALDSDLVLGPTEDGGYYAIGAKRTHPQMFQSVRWSSVHALDDTLRSCAQANLTTALGPAWFDIDDAAALETLNREPRLPRHTAAALAETRASAAEPA